MPNLAMRQPATQYARGGIEVAWPMGAERQVIEVADEDMTLDVKRHIAEGSIVITDDPPTPRAEGSVREYVLLTGDEARAARAAVPDGPVVRTVYRAATEDDEGGDEPVAVQQARLYSEEAIEAQKAVAAAAEEKSAAITNAQVEAEEAAAAAAAEVEEEEPEPDPAAEANADFLAAQEEAFMEAETARQEEAGEGSTEPAELDTSAEPDSSEADAAFMAQEEARQEVEAEATEAAEAEAEATAEADAEAAAEVEATTTGYAGKTDPSVEMSTVGRRAEAEVVGESGPSMRQEPPARVTAEATAEPARKKRGRKPKAAPAEESTESTTESSE